MPKETVEKDGSTPSPTKKRPAGKKGHPDEPPPKMYMMSEHQLKQLTSDIKTSILAEVRQELNITSGMPKYSSIDSREPQPGTSGLNDMNNNIPITTMSNPTNIISTVNVTVPASSTVTSGNLLPIFSANGNNMNNMAAYSNALGQLPSCANTPITQDMVTGGLNALANNQPLNIPNMSPMYGQPKVAQVPITSNITPASSGQQVLSGINTHMPDSSIFAPNGSVETLNAALLTILGKKEQTFNLPCKTLDRGISDAMRLQIWNNKYVNFLDLVIKNDSYANQSKPGTYPKGSKINTYQLWAKAFNIFHSIYVQKHPHLGGELCQYGELIRELYYRAPNTYAWRAYDEDFRFQRQSDLKSWDKMDVESWVTLTTLKQYNTPKFSTPNQDHYSKSYSNKGKNQNKGQGNSYQKGGTHSSATYQKCIDQGICFRYSQLANCKFEQCKYKHICHICNGKHSANQCKDGNGNAKPKGGASKQ